MIRAQGLGIEVNSGGELWKALAAGFAPGEIVFNGVAKLVPELEQAIGHGIQAINVDSAFELSRIAEVARKFCRVEMTSDQHPSGTDRIAEVISRCECDAAVNIQGDEPLIDPGVVNAVAQALIDSPMSTAATPIKDLAEYDNPNVVKVVVNVAGRALYFSRRTIPFVRDAASRPIAEQLAAFPFLKHLGIYGYRRETLLKLVKFPVSALEAAEKLEQLRALENGIQIAVVTVKHDSIGVDVPADVERVERLLRQ